MAHRRFRARRPRLNRRPFPAAGHRAARVACLGECMIELRARPDGLLARGFGGDTLNIALYLARLGVTVDYLTALGTDPFSDEMLAAWRAEGIGTDAVLRLPNALPGLYIIETDAGERRFSYWRDSAPARRLLDPPNAATLTAALAAHDVTCLSGITLSLFDAAGRHRLFAALDRQRAAGGTTVFDANFRPRGWPNKDDARHAYQQMLARSDLILTSEEDHRLLHADTGGNLDDWLTATHAEIVIKNDSPSCRILAADGTHEVPWHPATHVVDTTAAGDSFAAAYLAARLAGHAPEAAAQAGHRLAAAVVSYPGAIIPLEGMP